MNSDSFCYKRVTTTKNMAWILPCFSMETFESDQLPNWLFLGLVLGVVMLEYFWVAFAVNKPGFGAHCTELGCNELSLFELSRLHLD